MMKLFVLFFTICSVGFVFGMDADTIKKCIEESDANDEEIEKIMNRDIPESENEKCLMKCIMKDMKLINDNNLMDMEGSKDFVKHLTKENEEEYDRIFKIFEECNEETKDNPEMQNNCDASKLIVQCVMPKLEEDE